MAIKRWRFRNRRWGSLVDLVALWAVAIIIVIEMIRLVFTPNSIDGIVLVLNIVVLLYMLQ